MKGCGCDFWVILIGLILLLMETGTRVGSTVIEKDTSSMVLSSNGSQLDRDGESASYSGVVEGRGEEDSMMAAAEEEKSGINEVWSKIRHLHQKKVRLKDQPAGADYPDDGPAAAVQQTAAKTSTVTPSSTSRGNKQQNSNSLNATKPSRISRINKTSAGGGSVPKSSTKSSSSSSTTPLPLDASSSGSDGIKQERMSSSDAAVSKKLQDPKSAAGKQTAPRPSASMATLITASTTTTTTTGAPKLENKLLAMKEDLGDADDDGDGSQLDVYGSGESPTSSDSLDDPNAFEQENKPNLDIVTKFLTIVESQHLLGENCTAGTDFNLGEGVVDRYAQERFRLEAEVAVNRANWLTRLWKYADRSVLHSEYLLHVNLYSMIEMDEDIFAAGNCYDKDQYKNYSLFCPFAFRMLDGPILAKDLAVEYKYLANTSEWFYIARKNAEKVIRNNTQVTKAFHTYTLNETAHTAREVDEILSVSYEDGKWSKPYFDCGGGNIWMMTYTVPFFGFANDTYFFKGTSGIDIDLRRVDIDQCPQSPNNTQLNIFAASDKCKPKTTKCVHIPGLGFRRGSYRCKCKDGFYFPDKSSLAQYYNGALIEEEYEKKLMDVDNLYDQKGTFECLPCAEGCETCRDDSPCIITLNWVMRTTILILEIIVICCLPVVAIFTWRYNHIKVVRAASPALLRLIILGAFFIYCTILVAYTRPNMITCSLRVWLREIGFAFAYGALMLKTWRISVIFRVRSAKAVKITDLDLIKRLGIIVSVFAVFLSIRTMVGPPQVIVARTADDLKAYICQTDWWDHVFTAMEMVVLVWGIRLCIVVRKAPSEFNESRFISMAIYNEFLLSIFLNVSMLFLQSPANPDLMYIIMFSHAQLTTTLLLVLIFGSKAYLVFRGRGKGDDNSNASKPQAAKFLPKPKSSTSNVTPSIGSFKGDIPELSSISDPELQAEIRRLLSELEQLRDKTVRNGHTQCAARLIAMSQAARQAVSSPGAVAVVSTTLEIPDSGSTGNSKLVNGPSNNSLVVAETNCSNADGRSKKSSKNKRRKSKSPDGLGGMMFGGPKVNNVLACMTDKIVCATFSADPNAVADDDGDDAEEEESKSESSSSSSSDRMNPMETSPVSALAPPSSLALAAAPLLTSDFAFDTRGATALRIYSAPSSRRCSDQPLELSSPMSIQLSLIGDHGNSGALFGASRPTTSISVHSLCNIPKSEESIGTAKTTSGGGAIRRLSGADPSSSSDPSDEIHQLRYPLSPRIRRNNTIPGGGGANNNSVEEHQGEEEHHQLDRSVRSAHETPESRTPSASRSLSSSRSRINTEDRERFTEEVTV